MNPSELKIITVIGSGLIGRSWAMVFVSGGYRVKIYDNQPGQAARAVTEIRKQLEELEEARMLRGDLTAAQQLALLSSYEDLAQALEGAFFVQECVFEQLEVKQSVFQEIERFVGKEVILSSSTSCLVPSSVFAEVQERSRCLVSHPVNPPYYVKLVELVPHPETLATVMHATHSLMTKTEVLMTRLKNILNVPGSGVVEQHMVTEVILPEVVIQWLQTNNLWRYQAETMLMNTVKKKEGLQNVQEEQATEKVGQAPILLKKEIDGFALNRVQAAIIAESWRLVQDGVISVKDIDLVMSEGLGMRYAFIGPMETMHLNAPEGLEDYMRRYGEGITRVLNAFGPVPDFFGEPAKGVVKEMCELIPSDQQHLSARKERRDLLLMHLAKLKNDH